MKNNYPNIICNYMLSHVLAKIINLAVNMRLDEKLSSKPISIENLAAYYQYPPETFYRFLRALDSYDIVKLVGTNKIKSGKMCKYLSTIRSPHFQLSYQYINDLDYSLKNNTECFSKAFGKPMYPYFLDNPSFLNQFKVWCTKTAETWLPDFFKIYDFAKFNSIIDIGGGEGDFLAKILQKNKNQSGILFEQPAVAKSAEQVFRKHKVNDRVQVQTGDFFKNIPSTGDLYILSRVLINWSNQDALKILNNCYRNMPSGASLAIIDFWIPPKSSTLYKQTILSDLNVLALSNNALRTKAEWLNLVAESKFNIKQFYAQNDDNYCKSFLPMFLLELSKK